MLEPLIKTIEVPCSQEKAFRVFINEMDTWWPLGQFTTSAMSSGQPADAIRVDATPGGKIIEVWPNGTEYEWGTIKAYDPNDFLSMDFHIPRPGEQPGSRTMMPGEHEDSRTLVEVRFTALSEAQTRVELTQTNWEDAFGDSAPDIREGYDFGLAMIFEQGYKAALGG